MTFRTLLVASLVASLAASLAGCSGYGDSCSRGTYGDSCAPGLHCSAEYEGQSGICVCSGVDPDLEVGERCTDASECRACRRRASCNRATGRCVATLSVPPGGACSDDLQCAANTVCNRGLSQCEPPAMRALGEPCGASRDCTTGLVCGAPARRGVCAVPRREGEPCEADWCGPDLVCGAPLDPARCQPLGVPGSLCSDAAHCRPGLVCNGWFHPAQCGTGAAGEPCLDGGDCAAPLTCGSSRCG